LTIYSSPVAVVVVVIWVVVEVPVVTSKRPVRPYLRDKKQSSLVVGVMLVYIQVRLLIELAVGMGRIRP
jgi:threonine/homoserine/homoserine lactone efflux protein